MNGGARDFDTRMRRSYSQYRVYPAKILRDTWYTPHWPESCPRGGVLKVSGLGMWLVFDGGGVVFPWGEWLNTFWCNTLRITLGLWKEWNYE